MKKINTILKNKVFWYMGTRYLTYALQFFTTLLIAVILGTEGFGIWSFLILIVNFFNIVDWGIPNSLSVLLVQEKSNEDGRRRYITSGVALLAGMSFVALILFVFARYVRVPLLAKYEAGSYLPYLLVIVVLAYYNKLFQSVYRVRNRLFEVAFGQSIVPVAMFLMVVIIRENRIDYLIGAYVVGNVLALILYILRGEVALTSRFSKRDLLVLGTKGIWLFLYNSAFYFIMYVMSVGVSRWYTVEEYGMYNFAYTVSSAIVLLVDSFTFIVFPKMIDVLRTQDKEYCKQTLSKIRVNYTTVIHLLVYLILPVFYILCLFLDGYSDSCRAMCLSALALIPYSNAFGLNTYLIANNRERVLSLVSLGCLVLNVFLFVILTKLLRVPYDMVFLAVIISYTVYSLVCAILTNSKLSDVRSGFLYNIRYTYPFRQIVPYIIALISVFVGVYFECPYLLLLPSVCFLICNKSEMKQVMGVFRSIVERPQLIDLD